MTSNSNPLFQMEWVVNLGGYEVAPANAPKNLSLRKYLLGQTPSYRMFSAIRPKSDKWRTFNPFSKEVAGVAREFAALPIISGKVNELAVIDFANRYGLLGLGLSNGKIEEPLDEWIEKINIFKGVFKEIDEGSEFAHLAFNRIGVMPRMNLTISSGNRPWKRSLEITPATLYGAMWILVANEITVGTEMQPCQRVNCSRWFRKRSNKKFCTDYCRVAENRSSSKRLV